MRSDLLASLMLAVCVALPTGASAQTAPASRETRALSAAMAEARRSPFHATPMATLGDLGSPHSHPALDPGTGRADGTLSQGRVFALTAIGAVVGHFVGWYWFLSCFDQPCPGNLFVKFVGPLAVAVVGPTVGSAIAGGDVSDSLGGSALGMLGSLAVYYGFDAAGFGWGPAFLLSSLAHAGIATAVVTR